MKQKAFTLIEMITVVIIISILAAFAIPSFQKMITRTRARDAINNLSIIHASNAIYKVRNNANFACPSITDCTATPAPSCNMSSINNMNGTGSLNIIAVSGLTYCCDGTRCTADHSGFKVTVTMNNSLAASTNPACVSTSGGCP